MIGVALSFDADSDRRLRVAWDRLAAEGISTSMIDDGLWPHITLAICDRDDEPPGLRAFVTTLARGTPPVGLQLTAAAAFPGDDGIVLITPSPARALLDLHGALYEWLLAHGVAPHPHFVPGTWMPHCTMATRVPPERLGAAVTLCRAADVFGAVSMAGLVVAHPKEQGVEVLLSVSLAGA